MRRCTLDHYLYLVPSNMKGGPLLLLSQNFWKEMFATSYSTYLSFSSRANDLSQYSYLNYIRIFNSPKAFGEF